MRPFTHLVRPMILVAIWLMLPAPAMAQHDHGDHSASHAGEDAIPLYTTLGDHGRSITTSSPDAQAYFNQGLRLEYAFNHAEAIRSYEKALTYDDSCAMCWWGIALASGPNINLPMDEASGERAYAAIRRAHELSSGVSPLENRLIEALAERYDANPAAERAALDKAWAEAIGKLARDYPDDDDVLTLHGASLMNLNPWNYWGGTYGARTPNEGTTTLVASLENAVQLNRTNPGACHYYIHAVEAAFPERAVECADRLAALMPGAGHIVHMPGHIYIRVGRYRDAVAANDHAVHSDESFIADQNPMGIYPAAYYPHNYHFMAFAATMAGMSAKAMTASEIVSQKIPFEVAQEVYWLQNAVVFPQLTAVSFGWWQRALDAPLPSPELGQATAMAHYARGVAYAGLGRMEDAENERDLLDATASTFDPDAENPVLQIARYSLDGELALRAGDATVAVAAFEKAVAVEDEMLYEEPPLWYYPVRHSLGKALLLAGRAAEAEQVYEHDLLRFPENGWSLVGLALSLEKQGRSAEAIAVRKRLSEAWKDADIVLTSSRF